MQSLWYTPRRPPWWLRLLSVLFAAVAALRRFVYARGWLRSTRVGKPVIVIGNLTVGGSGKTPLVMWLCEQLQARGMRCGIVLRGYGGRASRDGEVLMVEPDSDAADVGDEALLLRRRCLVPVVVGRDRARAAQRLIAAGVDVIVSDDGLQHLALARDFEIAVVDSERALGNGWLLPAGPLREPAGRLRQVDAVVLNGADSDATARLGLTPERTYRMTLAGDRLRALDDTGEIALASLAGKQVHALAGIGHPRRFFAQLTAAGLQVIAHPFPDHHDYRAAELDFGDERPVLMTEKDAVKCRRFAAANRWYLPVRAQLPAAQAAQLLSGLQQRMNRTQS